VFIIASVLPSSWMKFSSPLPLRERIKGEGVPRARFQVTPSFSPSPIEGEGTPGAMFSRCSRAENPDHVICL
jgi:hypothetical protein